MRTRTNVGQQNNSKPSSRLKTGGGPENGDIIVADKSKLSMLLGIGGGGNGNAGEGVMSGARQVGTSEPVRYQQQQQQQPQWGGQDQWAGQSQQLQQQQWGESSQQSLSSSPMRPIPVKPSPDAIQYANPAKQAQSQTILKRVQQGGGR